MASPPPDFPRYSPAERIADGAIHVVGSSAAVIAAVWLIAHVDRHASGRQIIAVSLYCTGLLGTFFASAAYNLTRAGPLKAVLRRIDHAMIFLMIAGTYTPFAIDVLPPAFGIPLCATVWALALFGIGLDLASGGRHRRIAFALYLLMGWLGLVLLKPLAAAASGGVLLLLLAGGIVYSLGSCIHARGRGAFHNAIWHVMVVAAAGLHWVAIAMVVA